MNPLNLQGPPEQVIETPSRYNTTAELQDGVNYRIIPGKHLASKLVIHNNFGYSINKRAFDKESKKAIFYLKCKYKSCKARAFIRNNYCGFNEDNHPHTCQGEGASPARWYAQAALARMKERAIKETSTFDVSFWINYFVLFKVPK